VANAGPNQIVLVGATITLDGSGSFDGNGNPITYAWQISSMPSGSSATLTNPTALNPTFIADRAGNYVVDLVVNDGVSNSHVATVTISATEPAN
jgi:hypothetical protein